MKISTVAGSGRTYVDSDFSGDDGKATEKQHISRGGECLLRACARDDQHDGAGEREADEPQDRDEIPHRASPVAVSSTAAAARSSVRTATTESIA